MNAYDVQRTMVGRVPTYWAPVDGPIMACLSFRVGTSDETLATLGLSHLVEHLAMRGLERERFPNNATVALNRTSFFARGTRDEVERFLQHICRSLHELPLDLLDDERRILAAEAESRSGGLVDILNDIRFGPKGPGLNIYRQFGVWAVNAETVGAWAESRFVAEDAALWLTADPAGLDLNLHHGVAHPVADPIPLPLPLPISMTIDRPSVSVSMLGQRSWGMTLAIKLSSERAHLEARHGAGISYQVEGLYTPIGPKTAHVGLTATCQRPSEAQTLDILERVLREIAADGPTQSELDQARTELETAYADQMAIPGFLDRMAESELVQGEVRSARELLEELDAERPESVAEALQAVLPSAIVASRSGLTRTGHRPYSFAPPEVGGLPHPSLTLAGLLSRTYVVASDLGVAVSSGGKRVGGISYADCELMVVDGHTRSLLGKDGRTVVIRPGDWFLGKRIVNRLDRAIPQDRVHVIHAKPGLEEHKPGFGGGMARRLRGLRG